MLTPWYHVAPYDNTDDYIPTQNPEFADWLSHFLTMEKGKLHTITILYDEEVDDLCDAFNTFNMNKTTTTTTAPAVEYDVNYDVQSEVSDSDDEEDEDNEETPNKQPFDKYDVSYEVENDLSLEVDQMSID